ncbi:DegT/DnrJ/EryC1/StrS family aminotransferase [Thermodesulfobacteriota bacterium]
MQFIDLAAQQKRIKDKIDRNIQKVLAHGQYIMGPEIRELEKQLAYYVGVKHAIACSSGTDALLLSLKAYDIGPGDAIITTPFTFIGTAEVISLLGAIPIFVDIDPKTFNIDPEKLRQAIAALRTGDAALHPLPGSLDTTELTPRGVISVDMFGLPADYDRISKIAEENRLFLIEDAAQSFGAEYKERKTCSFGDIACTSFFPAKPLGCYGDGGMCFTQDDHLADILSSLLFHGKGDNQYDNVRIGINGRMDTLQAGILRAKFEIFPDEIEKRQLVARHYSDRLASYPFIRPPHIPEGSKSAWAQYSVLASDDMIRFKCRDKLQKEQIPTAVYYPKPLHLQEAFAFLGYKIGDFPISEDASKRIFSLPMHPYLTDEKQNTIVNSIAGIG